MQAPSHRILFVHAAPGIPLDGVGGASRHLREVVVAMIRLGHRVDLVARRVTREPDDPSPEWPCPVHRVPRGTLPGFLQRMPAVDETAYDLRLGRALSRVARSTRPTLVYERASLFSRAGMNLARRLDVAGVLELNAPLARERLEHEGLRAARYARHREGQVLRAARRVVAVSTALGGHAGRLGVEPSRIRIVPNGVDPRVFRPRQRPPLPPELGALEGRFRIGFCGTLKPWHDLGRLLDALAQTPGLASVALLVVGDGPRGAAWRRQSQDLGLEQRIVWAGARADDEVPALLAQCDVLCVPGAPSVDYYFSPLKLLEGMATGLSVVATDLGDTAAVAGGDPPAARLVPPGDTAALGEALFELSRDASLRQRLGAEGRRRAEGHSWERGVERSLEGL